MEPAEFREIYPNRDEPSRNGAGSVRSTTHLSVLPALQALLVLLVLVLLVQLVLLALLALLVLLVLLVVIPFLRDWLYARSISPVARQKYCGISFKGNDL